MRESTIQAAIRKAIAIDGRALVTRNNTGVLLYGAWVPSGVLAEAKRILREKAAEAPQEEGWT